MNISQANNNRQSFGMSLKRGYLEFIAQSGTTAQIKATTEAIPKLIELSKDVDLYPRISYDNLHVNPRWEVIVSKPNKTFGEQILHALGLTTKGKATDVMDNFADLEAERLDPNKDSVKRQINDSAWDLIRTAKEAKQQYLNELAEQAARRSPKTSRQEAAQNLEQALKQD